MRLLSLYLSSAIAMMSSGFSCSAFLTLQASPSGHSVVLSIVNSLNSFILLNARAKYAVALRLSLIAIVSNFHLCVCGINNSNASFRNVIIKSFAKGKRNDCHSIKDRYSVSLNSSTIMILFLFF